jgi:hypothetical protein
MQVFTVPLASSVRVQVPPRAPKQGLFVSPCFFYAFGHFTSNFKAFSRFLEYHIFLRFYNISDVLKNQLSSKR